MEWKLIVHKKEFVEYGQKVSNEVDFHLDIYVLTLKCTLFRSSRSLPERKENTGLKFVFVFWSVFLYLSLWLRSFLSEQAMCIEEVHGSNRKQLMRSVLCWTK